MVKHQHHAHSFKLSKKSTAPPTGPFPTKTPPLLHHLEFISLSEHQAFLCVGAAGFAQPVMLSIWLKCILRFRNKRQFFVLLFFLLCRRQGIGHRPFITPYGTGRCFLAKGTEKLGQHQVGFGIKTTLFGGLKGQRLWTVYWSVQSRLGKPK